MTPLQCYFLDSVQLMNETDAAIEDLALHFDYKQHTKGLEFIRNETLLGTPACISYIFIVTELTADFSFGQLP